MLDGFGRRIFVTVRGITEGDLCEDEASNPREIRGFGFELVGFLFYEADGSVGFVLLGTLSVCLLFFFFLSLPLNSDFRSVK